jgi:hypothetical protein
MECKDGKALKIPPMAKHNKSWQPITICFVSFRVTFYMECNDGALKIPPMAGQDTSCQPIKTCLSFRGTFRMEREDGYAFDCRIPPFSLGRIPFCFAIQCALYEEVSS